MTQFDAIGPFSGQWYTQNKMGRSSNSCQISDTIGAKNPRLKGAEFSYFILSLAPGLSQKRFNIENYGLGILLATILRIYSYYSFLQEPYDEISEN